ncbi:beta-1,4-mannosyltransferase [Rhodococcus sp. LBL1]|nr:beta-1,4-mannosyltransferase [Rhodococcus sp. LBL1]MDH6682371.1 beta-1,4-mannosyltransferase [Rhodococcus sp. LBL2]
MTSHAALETVPAIEAGRTLQVFFDTRERHWNQNPYISILAGSFAPQAEVHGFSWRRAVLNRYDVVHFHWPEYLLVHDSRLRRWAASALFVLMLGRIRLNRSIVIQTMHDRKPFVPVSRVHARLLGMLRRQTVGRIWLNEVSLAERSGAARGEKYCDTVILHGDYDPWIRALDPAGSVSREPTSASSDHVRLMCFGIMRPYKNFEQAAEAVGRYAQDADVSLYIAGSAPDEDYLSLLKDVASRYGDSVTLDARRLDDPELISAITRSTAVLVPYRDLYNSGVVFLSLSLGRPVILRRNPITEQLQAEYGSRWVALYDGDLNAEELALAVEAVRDSRGSAPKSEVRDAAYVAQRHLDFYRQLIRVGK